MEIIMRKIKFVFFLFLFGFVNSEKRLSEFKTVEKYSCFAIYNLENSKIVYAGANIVDNELVYNLSIYDSILKAKKSYLYDNQMYMPIDWIDTSRILLLNREISTLFSFDINKNILVKLINIKYLKPEKVSLYKNKIYYIKSFLGNKKDKLFVFDIMQKKEMRVKSFINNDIRTIKIDKKTGGSAYFEYSKNNDFLILKIKNNKLNYSIDTFKAVQPYCLFDNNLFYIDDNNFLIKKYNINTGIKSTIYSIDTNLVQSCVAISNNDKSLFLTLKLKEGENVNYRFSWGEKTITLQGKMSMKLFVLSNVL